jgi:hypothetical protein
VLSFYHDRIASSSLNFARRRAKCQRKQINPIDDAAGQPKTKLAKGMSPILFANSMRRVDFRERG